MRLLAHTIDVLSLSTSSVAPINVQSSWVDRNTTVDRLGSSSVSIASVATSTIVSAPTGSNIRNIRELTISNGASLISCDVKVLHYNGTGTVQIFRAKLLPGYQLAMTEVHPFWKVYDSSGQGIQVGGMTTVPTGTYLKTTNYDMVGTALFQPGPYTKQIHVRGVGGGGAGGGCTSNATSAAAAGGGGAGAYVEKRYSITTGMMPCFVYVGGGGTGVSAAAGGNGVDSRFTVPGFTPLIARGGNGATMATATGAAVTLYPGGTGGIGTTTTDIIAGGMPGRNGIITIRATTSTGSSGKGGDTPFGRGGAALTTANNGNAGIGYGSGGGGSFTNSSAARVGGNGMTGFWTIDEYA